MELLAVVGIGLCGLAVHLVLEGIGRKDMALLSDVVCGILLLSGIIQPLSQATEHILQVVRNTGLNEPTTALMLKIAGIALLTELAAQLCRDAGTGALAQKIELAGKGMILCAALPAIGELADTALLFLP